MAGAVVPVKYSEWMRRKAASLGQQALVLARAHRDEVASRAFAREEDIAHAQFEARDEALIR